MSEERVLTKEIAEQFLADEGDREAFFGDGYTHIEDAAAEVFGKLHHGGLYLDDLIEISDTAAKYVSLLANGEERIGDGWGGLSIGGKYNDDSDEFQPCNLSTKAIATLAQYQGILSLNGLSEIDDETATSVVEAHDIGGLYLFGLKYLSDQATATLCKLQGSLYLVIDQLPPSAAEIVKMQRREDDENEWVQP